MTERYIRNIKVLVSRPSRVPAPAPIELRRPDVCSARSGEILVPPGPTCRNPRCTCSWSFYGANSAKPTSWGVVEVRSIVTIAEAAIAAVRVRLHRVDDGSVEAVLDAIYEISRRVQSLPAGTMSGIWALSCGCFGLYPRTPRSTPATARRRPGGAEDDGTPNA